MSRGFAARAPQTARGATGGVGRNSKPSPGEIWARYAANIVAAKALPCGHYLSEEAPEETMHALREFLAEKDVTL